MTSVTFDPGGKVHDGRTSERVSECVQQLKEVITNHKVPVVSTM